MKRNWEVWQNGYPILSGLTRHQAERTRVKNERRAGCYVEARQAAKRPAKPEARG